MYRVLHDYVGVIRAVHAPWTDYGLMAIRAFFFVTEPKGKSCLEPFQAAIRRHLEADTVICSCLTLEDVDLLLMRSMRKTAWIVLEKKNSVHDGLADASPTAVYAPSSEQ